MKTFPVQRLKYASQLLFFNFGKRPEKTLIISRFISSSNELEESEQLIPEVNLDSDYKEISKQYLNPALNGHNALVIQPYIKWGHNKKRNTTPDLQLAEAVALIETLNHWNVTDAIKIPLMSLEKKKLFGKGNIDTLRERIQRNSHITAVFISKNLLRHVQIMELQAELGVPVYDRYSIVIQIFKEHAKTAEAKLQVALAELPYIWKKINWTVEDTGGRVNLTESRKMVLHKKEARLKADLKKIREYRKIVRTKRAVRDIPSVAVVGYTNAGKTCLIKALTGDKSLVPENKLFATLDTTAYAGSLPCRLEVLYIDTIGFIQDIPQELIEPFVATFEDAIVSDVIVHVFDASHPDMEAQVQHVRATLSKIITDLNISEKPIIEVANKCDLIPRGTVPDDVLAISAINSTGIDLLRQKIEKDLLIATERMSMIIRVKSGSLTAAWLYKEITVTHAEADPDDPQYSLLNVIITQVQLYKFRNYLRNSSGDT